MVLRNNTRNTVLSRDIKRVSGFFGSALGLLDLSNPRSIMLETRFGIHTFFMKKPIDVLVADEDFRVRSLRSSLRPFRLYFWNPKYKYVFELPEGTIGKSDTSIGDVLKIEKT